MTAIISDNIYLGKMAAIFQIMFNNQKLPAGPRIQGAWATWNSSCKENLYWKDYGLLLNTIDDIKIWSLET